MQRSLLSASLLTLALVGCQAGVQAAEQPPSPPLQAQQSPEPALAGAAPGSDARSEAAFERPVPAPACAAFNDPAILKSIEGPARELQAANPVFAPPVLAGRRARVEPSPAASAAPEYLVSRPPRVSPDRPVRVFLAVHGVASNGSDFASPLVPISQANNWLLIAPTLQYHNYDSALETRADDHLLFDELDALLADVPRRTGLTIEPKVLAIGFSRGAGLLERYAMARPERIAGLASMSSGAYTLPQGCAEAAGQQERLPFPLGTADLERWAGRGLDADAYRRIPLWLAVGAKDVTEPPAQWDSLLGKTRVERAEAYSKYLRQFGKTAELRVYPGLKHEVTKPEFQDAADYLRSAA